MAIEHLIPFLASTAGAATPLMLAALGELVTERSGVLNLGLEGLMAAGAVAGFAATLHSGSLGMAGTAPGSACQPEGPAPLCPSRATHDPSVPGLGAGAHHLPLRTDVGPRPQDHQKPQLSCQVQEGFHIPVPSKVINPRQWLVVVPGDVAGARGEIGMWGLRAPRHNGEPSHRPIPLLLGTGLQPGLRAATGAGLGLAQAHAGVWQGRSGDHSQPSARAGPCSL